MHNPLALLVGALSWLSYAQARHEDKRLVHANHIFNAINSAMRQFGSSLNHNGLSAFIATVPADTEFYHGTSTPYPINSTEWLAFEPEHALIFARPPRRPPPDRGPREKPGFWRSDTEHRHAVDQQPVAATLGSHSTHPQPAGESSLGYLHTYRTKHDLRLLYVDGQSAAKCAKGTLDLQDVVILRNQLSQSESSGTPLASAGGPMQESERAQLLCEKAATHWQGRIDGILRMEGGFEIILCSFEQHLNLLTINAVHSEAPSPGAPRSQDHLQQPDSQLHYYKAVAARYDGIGGHRVALNLQNFTTLFADPNAVYFDNASLPRAKNDNTSLQLVRQQIDDMVLADAPARDDHLDWQAVTDMVVSRYGDAIISLASAHLDSVDDLHREVRLLLQPFIHYSDRNPAQEIHHCARQFLDHGPDSRVDEMPLARAVVLNVTTTICSTLLDISCMKKVSQIKQTVNELREWLAWTAWKRCRGCRTDEVCFLPIWPAGTVKDFDKPSCKSSFARRPDQHSYWDD